MQRRAFEILGIEPTLDRGAIKSAFVRLARIYHPDRFVGMPEDVRAEAERRMKEVAIAYETLLAAKKQAVVAAKAKSAAKPSTRGKDPWEDVRRARAEIAARRAEQERSRARWLLWEELERQARERADLEAQMAGVVLEDLNGRARASQVNETEPDRLSLSRRLEQARVSQTSTSFPTRRSF